MKRRIIISIYDDCLQIGAALDLLSAIGYDSSGGWDTDCVWEMSDGHWVRADIKTNKGSIKFDIWRRKPNG